MPVDCRLIRGVTACCFGEDVWIVPTEIGPLRASVWMHFSEVQGHFGVIYAFLNPMARAFAQSNDNRTLQFAGGHRANTTSGAPHPEYVPDFQGNIQSYTRLSGMTSGDKVTGLVYFSDKYRGTPVSFWLNK